MARCSPSRSGERRSRISFEDVVTVQEVLNMTFLPMNMHHVANELETPLDHKLLFGGPLLVQAQEEGLRLLAVDRSLFDNPFSTATHELG